MASQGTKRRKLAHDEANGQSVTTNQAQKDFFKNAADWHLEEDYEQRRRKTNKKAGNSNRLPQIKTSGGRAELLPGPVVENGDKSDDDISVGSDDDWLEGREVEPEPEVETADKPNEKPEIPESQQILEAQEELARLAMAVNEKPDEHIGALKALAKIGQSALPAIQMLALLTQLTVYKDVIPGYRIRPLSEDAPKEKVSKEVRQTRQFEQALVHGYAAYVKELARCAKLDPRPLQRGGQSVASIAISCACSLTTAVPHFNFHNDVLRILVGRLSRRRADADAVKCLQALEELFRDDDEGRPSFEAAALLAKMMRARDYQVDERVLNLFLSLRLLTEFSGKASRDRVDRRNGDGGDADGAAQPSKRQQQQLKKATKKHQQQQHQFRTKRERKALKERKALDRDMAQADALVGHEERERMQSETLKVVFATYFRILKLREPHLMGAVLEGLARYAHLINQDFFGDLLEALKDLIRHSDRDADADASEEADAKDDATANGGNDDDQDKSEDEDDEENEDGDDISFSRNLTREALLCTVTAFALLAGQDAHNSRRELHLDLSFFTTHLFHSLLPLCTDASLETTRSVTAAATVAAAKSSPSTSSRVNFQTTAVLLIRSLTGVLLPPWNVRQVPPLRVAAFAKQLMTATLQLPDRSAQAALALAVDVAATHPTKVASLWHTDERKGDGAFNPLSRSVEASNPFASTVWEGELLRRHFSPKVRDAVKLLEKGVSSSRG